VPGAIYHVTARGNHRHDIFFKHADRQLLDEIMANALAHTGARIHAYCWMTNHVHLLVEVADQPLGVLMQRVGTRFARAIQRGLHTTGHLFENRYHAVLVDVDSYFLELLRYIHLNPVRAGIVAAPDQYLWSSHRVYMGTIAHPWVHTSLGLSLFSANEPRARQLYRLFIDESVGVDPLPAPAAHPHEPRVLGGDGFLKKLSVPVLRRHADTTLDAIATQVCNEFGVTIESVRSPSQHRALCLARACIAVRAIDGQAATLSDVARYLNRSASALSRAVSRHCTRLPPQPQPATLQT
jgi:REP element-mobilizing transposase RayT